MGTAQARQQALVSRGSRSGAPTAGLPGGTTYHQQIPSDVATGDTPRATGEEGQDERIPVVFNWAHGGAEVYLAASFNNWGRQIPMVRSGNEFHVVQDLPRGIHQYKFIVDGHWRFSPDQPKSQGQDGNTNNTLDIQHYQCWKLEEQDEPQHRIFPPPTSVDEARLNFGQHIPDQNDYTIDAPVIPIVLSKSAFCAVPAKATSLAAQPLSIPTHSISDHVFLHDNADDSTDFDVSKVAMTHRFGHKYSTSVFVTRSPFDGCGAQADKPGGVNLLKRAVRGC